jgi:hypothetical protein
MNRGMVDTLADWTAADNMPLEVVRYVRPRHQT